MHRPSIQLDLLESKDFQRHLKRLSRRGGLADAVHRQVIQALILWARGEDPQLPLTHHGESRVPHVVKYDLLSYHRLVVYEHAGKRIPLMVGDHEDVDRWLASNRGKDFTVNEGSQRIQFTVAATDDETTNATTRELDAIPTAKGSILARIPQDLFEKMGISPATFASLDAFATFEEIEDERIWTLIQALSFPTEEHRNVVLQVIALVAKGQEEQAQERIQLFLGNAATATEAPDEFAHAVDSGQNSDVLLKLSAMSAEDIERLLTADGFTEWMLFLHPDQRRLVDRDYSGPARLVGVSGSGKTSVLIHRANSLAKKYPGERVLVLTLNPALGQLLSHLLDRLCSPECRQQIQVQTLYEYCYQAVKTIAPSSLIERLDPRSGEDLKACWNDFMEKPHALSNVETIIRVLESREDSVDGASYVLDELIWIRSGFGRSERDEYLMCDRPGRGIPLPRFDSTSSQPTTSGGDGLPQDTRPRILRLLHDYEEYMRTGGLLDEDGVSLEAFSVKNRIRSHDSLRARCILVDEVQDCSTVELAVIASISTAEENGVFLTGDPVQKVYAKQGDLMRAGVDIRGRGAVLRTNYRNTRQILEAAFQIIDKFRELSPVPPSDVLQPEYAFKEGPKPKLYECASPDEQIQLVMTYLSYFVPEDLDTVCICSPTEATLDGIAEACAAKQIATHRIRGTSPRDAMISKGVKFALLQDIKGYEFGHVFIIDLTDAHVLPKGMPWEERWRVAFQIYVAMTRAREELIMTFVFNPSILLRSLGDTVDECIAKELW